MKRVPKKSVFFLFLAAAALVAFYLLPNGQGDTSHLPTVQPDMSQAEIDALRFPEKAWSNEVLGLLHGGPKVLSPDFDTGIPPAPANGSEQTKKDIKALLEMQSKERTPEELSRIQWENTVRNPGYIFERHNLLDMRDPALYKLTYAVLEDVTYFLMREKDKYQRARPTQLEPSLAAVIRVPPHAAYPSAHSGQTYAVALLLGMIDPSHKAEYEKLSVEVAHRREIAGVHYPSDSEAGRILAKNVVAALMKTDEIKALYEAVEKEHAQWAKNKAASGR